jgi:hypothetical protein
MQFEIMFAGANNLCCGAGTAATRRTHMTRLLVSSIALAALLASPALAASRAPRAQSGHDAYAAANGPRVITNRTLVGPNAVVFGNRVVGQDPDVHIRAQIQHDPVPNEY